MGINVTITADSAEELRTLLAGFSTLVTNATITGASVTASAPSVEKAARTRKPAEPSVTDAQPEEKEAVQTVLFATLEDFRARVAEIAQSGKQTAVKALLTKFEAKSVSTLPEEQRAAFLEELEAL